MNVFFEIYPSSDFSLERFTLSSDFFAKAFEHPLINFIAVCIYLLGCIGISGFVVVIWYERSGRAGPYRTLVNQIVTFNLEQLVIWFTMATGLDMLRILTGPMPQQLCTFVIFVKNVVNFNVTFISLVLTATNYIFIGIYKSVPCIDDNFLSAFIHMLVNMLGFIFTATYLCLPGKPLLNQVTLELLVLLIWSLFQVPSSS